MKEEKEKTNAHTGWKICIKLYIQIYKLLLNPTISNSQNQD